MALDLETPVRVWATFEGLAEERFVLEVGPHKVRLVFPTLKQRALLGMAIGLLLVPYFAALALFVAFPPDTVVARTFIILLLTLLLAAGAIFVGRHVWPFVVRNPRTAMDARVTAIERTLVGLRLRLAIRREVPMPPYYGPPSSAVSEYIEDRWVLAGSRRRVLAALGPSAAPGPPR